MRADCDNIICTTNFCYIADFILANYDLIKNSMLQIAGRRPPGAVQAPSSRRRGSAPSRCRSRGTPAAAACPMQRCRAKRQMSLHENPATADSAAAASREGAACATNKCKEIQAIEVCRRRRSHRIRQAPARRDARAGPCIMPAARCCAGHARQGQPGGGAFMVPTMCEPAGGARGGASWRHARITGAPAPQPLMRAPAGRAGTTRHSRAGASVRSHAMHAVSRTARGVRAPSVKTARAKPHD